jgi:acyl carrier protein
MVRRSMAQRAIEDVIIGFLAENEKERTSAEELRHRLEETGAELPIDSVLAVEVLVLVQNHFGVRLPLTAETARCLRSVSDFAAKVQALVEEATVAARAEGA